jgi:hypothetical protein
MEARKERSVESYMVVRMSMEWRRRMAGMSEDLREKGGNCIGEKCMEVQRIPQFAQFDCGHKREVDSVVRGGQGVEGVEAENGRNVGRSKKRCERVFWRRVF